MSKTNFELNIIKGIIYGGAIGDALGLATEFMSRNDINKHYENIKIFTYSDIVQDYHRSIWKKGDWTDDTDQTIIIMKSIIEDSVFNTNTYANKLIELINNGLPECDDTKSHGVGNSITLWWGDKYALSNPHKAGLRAFIYNPFNQMSNESNGGIMKSSVLATVNFNNIDDVIKNTINMCSVTHPSPICVYSCIVLNYIIAQLIKTSDRSKKMITDIMFNSIKETKDYIEDYINQFKQNISDILLEENDDDDMLESIKEIIRKKYDSVINNITTKSIVSKIETCFYYGSIELCELDKHIGHTLKPFICAIYALDKALNGESFEQIISNIILEGGDADTNCTVAGSMLGAFYGYTNIPSSYVNDLVYESVLNNYVEKYIAVI